MLEEAELAEVHGEHIHAVGAGEELIAHKEEGAAALAGNHGVHHLEDGTLRGRGGDGADGIRMDDRGFAGMGGDLGDLGEEKAGIAAGGEDEEICGAFVALLAEIAEGGSDEGCELPIAQGGENHDAVQLLDNGIELFPAVRLLGAEEEEHRGGRNGGEILREAVVRLGAADEGRMIADDDEPAIGHERQGFRRGDDLVRFRSIEKRAVQFLQTFRQELFLQGIEGGLLHMLLFTLEEQHGGNLPLGKETVKILAIHDQRPPGSE